MPVNWVRKSALRCGMTNFIPASGDRFYHRYKEDIALMAEMGLRYFVLPLPGAVSTLTAMS
jgi:beta-glucosidase/6-phospho-beta-glucosidase/beta-galactosidase